MRFDFDDFAAKYGLREQPVIVTDSKLNTQFYNRLAANRSVLTMSSDFIKKSLTPASMQRVQRFRRTHQPTSFTQDFGGSYKEKYRVMVTWEQERYIAFTFSRPNGYRESPPLTEIMAESDMNGALQNMLGIAELIKNSRTSPLTNKQLYQLAEKTAFYAIRCTRQQQFKRREPVCFAFHIPTLFNEILYPCARHLKDRNIDYQIHYQKASGDGVVKCDAFLMRYVIYAIISTVMHCKKSDITVRYSESPTHAQIDILNGEDRPLILSDVSEETSRVNCDALGLSTAYLLVEKMQGQLDARRLADSSLMFTLRMPTNFVEGAFRERVSSQLSEQISTLKIEFSIL